MDRAPAGQRRTTVRVALLVLGIVVVLVVAELVSPRFRAFIGDHALLSTFLAEAVLLVGVYLVIDEVIQRREARRWSDVMSLGIRALSTTAEEPAAIVRRAVDDFAGTDGAPDYRELTAGRADELARWLVADAARARSFAEDMRRSASRLEEAIVRWGPTLVEDSEAAGALNLLPDVVDAARSAADTISAGTNGEGFRDSVLEILGNAEEFQTRASRVSSRS
jgi:hypothetical protein